MMNAGNCSLVIRADKLNFDEIEENLEMSPSRIVRKGEVVSKAIGSSEFDIWIYEVKEDEEIVPNKTLGDLVAKISPKKIYLQKLVREADVRIKCFVQSDYAQINFEFSPKVINELASMCLKLEMSIMSWGRVKS